MISTIPPNFPSVASQLFYSFVDTYCPPYSPSFLWNQLLSYSFLADPTCASSPPLDQRESSNDVSGKTPTCVWLKCMPKLPALTAWALLSLTAWVLLGRKGEIEVELNASSIKCFSTWCMETYTLQSIFHHCCNVIHSCYIYICTSARLTKVHTQAGKGAYMGCRVLRQKGCRPTILPSFDKRRYLQNGCNFTKAINGAVLRWPVALLYYMVC